MALGVGPTSAYQAVKLMDRGHPFPLLMDPDRKVAVTLQVGTQGLLRYLSNLVGWLRYLRRFLRARRQGRFTGHYSYLPAVAVVNAESEVTWSYRGRSLADYPPIAKVLERLEEQTNQRGS